MNTIKEHYEAELTTINARLKHYTEWGYSPELRPIVVALKECRDKLTKAMEEL